MSPTAHVDNPLVPPIPLPDRASSIPQYNGLNSHPLPIRSRKSSDRTSTNNDSLPSLTSSSSPTFFSWLLVDLDESSRLFLSALSPSQSSFIALNSPSLSGSIAVDPSSVNSSFVFPSNTGHLPPASLSKHAPPSSNPFDKRLSLPFGPTKKSSFISKLRGGSGSFSTSVSGDKDKPSGIVNNHSPTITLRSPPTFSSPKFDAERDANIGGVTRKLVQRAICAIFSDLSSSNTEAAALVIESALKRVGIPTDHGSFTDVSANHPSTTLCSQERLRSQQIASLAQSIKADAVYFGGLCRKANPQSTRALIEHIMLSQSGIKAVVVDPTITRNLTATDANSLMETAQRLKMFLGLPTRWGREPELGASRLATDCASHVLFHQKLDSPAFPWTETLAVLESLDEYRQIPQPFPSASNGIDSSGKLATIDDVADTSLDSLDGSIVDLAAVVPSSLTNGAVASGPTSLAALRSQVQELQHTLRRKDALITTLESLARTGSGPGVDGSPSSASRSRPRVTSLTADEKQVSRSSTPTRLRRSSASSQNVSPGPTASPSPSTSSAHSRRTSKNDTELISISSTTTTNATNTSITNTDADHHMMTTSVSSPSQLDTNVSGEASNETSNAATSNALPRPREPVIPPRNLDNLSLSGSTSNDGYRSPTVASENRRIASLTQAAHGLIHASSSATSSSATATGSSGRVIHQLTTELEETRTNLETTRSRLRAAQKQTSTLQRQYEDLKDSLGRSRLENESATQMLARKERQASEALERARRAESEAKELGRASREWGTRVREVEAQLGEERTQKAKIDAQYETLSTCWKTTREKLIQQVQQLEQQVYQGAQKNSKEANRLVQLKSEMEIAWKQRDQEKGQLGEVLEQLKLQQLEIQVMIQQSVGNLSKRLETFETETKQQDNQVEHVSSELNRILRLMRSGTVTSPVVE